ncbi:signal recognition particle-docking protein FtsY [Testudinibacter sp. TR-2022]|uniref:signal recognition particle-docking protein FtsY n=1 Tax=Testudinibacter sp. TR-2022 TaxID=2585029 RepID=UPI001119CAFC|nr:signal recognition particle-docking protein FtsY [Testudinibacter sp. TR-2022]TNH06710.1 signal recognition particle-docking protein FtsY [Pasteurellaceae bacterium Phil11]TNH22845.1 signal recognition particle-docking protein FtsY [Testudinibacter sp. TR-2022]TNH25305.1 signal recognition particle-docking protein FtsY [Testudinibacter sp. TR-2022]
MTDNKKKSGFWSWLGLGSKEQQQTEQQAEALAQQQAEQQAAEKVRLAQEQAEQEAARQAEALAQQQAEQQAAEKVRLAQAEQEAARQAEALAQQQAEQEAAEKVRLAQAEQEAARQAEALAQQQAEQQAAEKARLAEQEAARQAEALAQQQAEQEAAEKVRLAQQQAPQPKEQEKPSEGGFFSRLLKGLVKTKQNLGSGFRNLFTGKKIDDELFEELEEQLLIADIGMPTTTKIIHNLTQHASKKELRDAEQLYQKLKDEMAEILQPVAQPLVIGDKKPFVILMVGVNGVGKTTTIGKLARQFQSQGKSVMLAAGDTFRAAAVEQLQVWGERNHIPVVAQSSGSDSASVLYDALESAKAKNIDILLADTAGRLQNKNNLMDELKKIVRVMQKIDPQAPHEIMLTLDAGTGQNAISQAKLFNEAVGLTGITLTKLDGTAKGGVIFAIADQFKVPIRYIGVGEKIDDLRPFEAKEFIEALFSQESE